MDQKETIHELIKMAGSIDLETEVPSAFSKMEYVDALGAIDTRLRQTRFFIEFMEAKIYAAKQAVRS